MIGEGARVEFGEFAEFDASERVELMGIANCDEGFELGETKKRVGVYMAENGRFIYQGVTGTFEKGGEIEEHCRSSNYDGGFIIGDSHFW